MKLFRETIFPILALLLLMGGCFSQCQSKRATESKFKALELKISQKLDSIERQTITKTQLEEDIILWKTLEIEELSDKERVPINQLKIDYRTRTE